METLDSRGRASLDPRGLIGKIHVGERSGSVVECLTRDQGPGVRASPASLRCVLEQEH